MSIPLSFDAIFGIKDPVSFDVACKDIYSYQYKNNSIYQNFARNIGFHSPTLQSVSTLPFLPISIYKHYRVSTMQASSELRFFSSGTTTSQSSTHYVYRADVYERSFRQAFEMYYGHPTQYRILALLPSYLEREGSSLIYMVNSLMKDAAPGSEFYLYDNARLMAELSKPCDHTTLLIGVSFALVDFADYLVKNSRTPLDLSSLIVMETGGMKGRKQELTRGTLHAYLQKAFGVPSIHSEYGMTEMLSQAYALNNGRFMCPPWMKVTVRDLENPLRILPKNEVGAINVIDLGCVYSCSFIATDDIGRVYDDGTFEVLGRTDYSEVRGCNLMIVEQ